MVTWEAQEQDSKLVIRVSNHSEISWECSLVQANGLVEIEQEYSFKQEHFLKVHYIPKVYRIVKEPYWSMDKNQGVEEPPIIKSNL